MDLVAVDPHSPIPPYEQIRSQIAGLVAQGVLRPTTRLPPVRRLAADLGLAAGTVARAYRDLEVSGVLTTDGRRGTSVASSPSPERERAVELAARFVDDAEALGLGDEEVVAIIRRLIEDRSAASSGRAR